MKLVTINLCCKNLFRCSYAVLSILLFLHIAPVFAGLQTESLDRSGQDPAESKQIPFLKSPVRPELPGQPDLIPPPGVKAKTDNLSQPGTPVSPETPPPPGEIPRPAQPEPAFSLLERYEWMIDNAHEELANRITNYAAWLDSFFRESTDEIEENKSYAKLSAYLSLEEEEGLEHKLRARVRLVLPEFEDRLHFMVSGSPDEETEEEEESPAKKFKTDTGELEDKGGLTASLRYFFKQTLKDNLSMRAGLRFSGFEPVALLEPRYRTATTIKPWTLRFSQSLRWYSDDGYRSITRLDMERPFTPNVFFRISTEGNWYEDSNGYYYSVKCATYQRFKLKRVLEYLIGYSFRTRPYHELTEITYRLKYRRRLWREWLFFEVTPQVALRNDNQYEPCPGIFFKFDVIIGPYR